VNETTTLQQKLFAAIKENIPGNLSVVDVVAEVLSVSDDSAYRRLRGEKPLSLEELYLLSKHFHLSIDRLFNNTTNGFLFEGTVADASNFSFTEYMIGMQKKMMYLNSFKQKKFYYLCKDIPVFLYFIHKDLAVFKYYFWMKTLLQVPAFMKRKVNLDEPDIDFLDYGIKSLECYNNMDTVEIWNFETLNSTLRQIDFYHQAKFFDSRDDVWRMYDVMQTVTDHVERQAEAGCKFALGDSAMKPLSSYKLYFNEVILGDNSMLIKTDETKIVFLIHGAINYMATRDIAFCDNIDNYFQALMKKSTLISSVSEKERSNFFKTMRSKIESRKRNI